MARGRRGPLKVRMASSDIDAAMLRELVVGDIGGILIPMPTLTATKKQRVDEINDMWTGLSLDRLAAIAKRAVSGRGLGGVIVIAFGREKLESIVQSVQMGLVNELVIDHELEKALSEAL